MGGRRLCRKQCALWGYIADEAHNRLSVTPEGPKGPLFSAKPTTLSVTLRAKGRRATISYPKGAHFQLPPEGAKRAPEAFRQLCAPEAFRQLCAPNSEGPLGFSV